VPARPGQRGTAPELARPADPGLAGTRRVLVRHPGRLAHGLPGSTRVPLAERSPAAHPDSGEDREAADHLTDPGRVPEDDDARDGTDHRFDVDKRAGDLRRYPLLAVGEERERRKGPGHHERERREHGTQATRIRGREPAGARRDRQHADGRAEELHSGDRHRVTTAQQPRLSHQEHGGQRDRGENEPVTGDRGAASRGRSGPGGRDQADASQGCREARPGQRPDPGTVPDRGDDRDQDRNGADQQRGVADAGHRDACALQEHRTAVPERT